MLDESMLEAMVFHSPLTLLAIKDKQVIQQINKLVPYSTAFEIECRMASDETEVLYLQQRNEVIQHNEIFRSIPDIMSVNNGPTEQRYRVPNGLKGIICVYHICKQLKIHSLLNPLSSIHYHVDCTDCFPRICNILRQKENIDYVLSELDTWLGSDEAVSRGSGTWFKLNDLETVEFRLGEMTFEYEIILKRIIHCNKIVKKFKDQIYNIPEPVFEEPNAKILLEYNKANNFNTSNSLQSRIYRLNRELERIRAKQESEKEVKTTLKEQEDIKNIIGSRVHKVH